MSDETMLDVVVTPDGPLVPGQRVSGRDVGRDKNGRVVFRATWSGTYVGERDDIEGERMHTFRDGEINGHAQTYFGFPIDQIAR